MVARDIGWLGLLALLPCVLAFQLRESPPLDCAFMRQCDAALFGFNDKTVRDVTAEQCKQACLDETEFTCLSVDYIADSQSCYLSRENVITQSTHIGPHFGADHYSWLCGDDKLAMMMPVPGTDCGFLKQCGLALFGFNTKTVNSVSLDLCMRACVDEVEFECLSFDYSPDSQLCFLSEESADTQPVHVGPHFGVDYYQKICFFEIGSVSETGSGDVL